SGNKTGLAKNCQATYRKSQRYVQHDQSGCTPGRTRPSKPHLIANTTKQKKPISPRLAAGITAKRKTGRVTIFSATVNRRYQKGSTNTGTSGRPKRSTSQNTRVR